MIDAGLTGAGIGVTGIDHQCTDRQRTRKM